MTKMTLTDLLKIGESQSVEFKQSLSLQREALEALCGMLNSEGGRGLILFGVKPDNSICGIESGNMDSAQKSLVQTIQQKFDPKILCDIQTEVLQS